MRVLIAGTIDLDPERRDEALQAGKGPIDDALTQKGCLAYAWTADPFDAGRVHVFEHWETAEDLARHLEGPFYAAMLSTLSRFGLRGFDVAKYGVDRTGPVYDREGKPRADFF